MIEKIKSLRSELESAVAEDAAAVEALRIKYLSKKGAISALMNDFRNVAPEQKRELGQALNELKTYATERINALREAAERGNDKCGELDLTRTPAPSASVHATRCRLYASKSSTSSAVWASLLPKGLKLKTTGMYSSR